MRSALDLINDLKTINIKADANLVIESNKDAITAYNKAQMLRGTMPDGSRIGVYGSKDYARMKQTMNPLAGGGVDMKLTGAFQGGMFTIVDDEGFETSSSDGKLGMLVEKYDDPFGLQDANQDNFNQYVFLPDYLKLIEMKTGLRAN